MNSMTIYNNIQYERLQSQRPFDSYTPDLSKSINNNNNKSNNGVNDPILFYINIQVFFLLQSIGQMTPITNISVASSTNSIMTTQSYTPSGRLKKQQQQQTDLSINKLPSSTLVDLLKHRRSPPPPPLPPPQRPLVTNNSLSITTRQQKQNSIIKQPKKPSKKSQIQTKRLAGNNNNNNNNNNNIRVNLNSVKLFYLKIFSFYLN